MVKPFVNYIGSKLRFLSKIENLLPDIFNEYYEPFVGGGSVMLHVHMLYDISKCHLNDNNADVMNCYKQIKKRPTKVIKHLESLNQCSSKSKKRFDELVDEFNGNSLPKELRCAAFIYLSKVAYNSRFNYGHDGSIKPNHSKWNTQKDIYSPENILNVSKLLQRCKLYNMDYKRFLIEASPKKGDFVFLDPPYLVQQVNSYYDDTFDYGNFEELYAICKKLDKRGVKWMLTVNNHKKLKSLFSDFDITFISKHSSLSSGRGQEHEMIVKNY